MLRCIPSVSIGPKNGIFSHCDIILASSERLRSGDSIGRFNEFVPSFVFVMFTKRLSIPMLNNYVGAIALLLLIFPRHAVMSILPIPEIEYWALYDLYNSTNGVSWIWSDNPLAGTPWAFVPYADPCSDAWQGVTCVVTPSPATFHISELQLSRMNLSGRISPSIGSLAFMSYLTMSRNNLIGTIPSSCCDLHLLVKLSLDSNSLSGSIPECIGNLAEIQYLVLDYNQLTEYIPNSVCEMLQLTYLNLNANWLTGPIPDCIGNLTGVQLLYLQDNHLTGTIPNSVCRMRKLTHWDMDTNWLTGPIPDCIGNLTEMQFLFLENNQLTGHIPCAIGEMPQLVYLDLSTNGLSGFIPPSIGNLTVLFKLMLYYNHLTGVIPDSVGNITTLSLLYLYNNELTGSIPNSVSNLNSLIVLYLHYNLLTGTIPSDVGEMSELLYFYAYSNMLSGSLPNSIGDISQLTYLWLFYNHLSGTIPRSLSNLTALTSLALQYNHFTGPLSGVFSASQRMLATIALDKSQLTGTLPAEIFQLPALMSISMVDSCLHGTLPGNICNATSLEAVIFYGLSAGESCRPRGVESLTQAQSLGAFKSAFPACLLGMPNLVTLLLSSNGLTGSISADTIVGTNLLELDLSHNKLSGSIPHSIQNRTWALLDLSHNKLNGVLQAGIMGTKLPLARNNSIYSSYRVVSLNSNRLSGPVPSSLDTLQSNLSVVAGNLFQCKYDKSDLPQHDSDISNYDCASNGFNIAIYAWLALCILAMTVFAFLGLLSYRLVSSVLKLLWEKIRIFDSLATQLTHLNSLLAELRVLSLIGWYCTTFCMLVLLPFYVAMSHYEGTHTHQYAYVLSAIYISGVAPFVCELLLLVALIALFLYSARQWQVPEPEKTAEVTTGLTQAANTRNGNSLGRRACVWTIFATVNVTVVLGVNIAFVYVVLYQSSQLQIVVQILLSFFKLGWSNFASPTLMRSLENYFLSTDTFIDTSADTTTDSPTCPTTTVSSIEPFLTLQLLVALFNNIAIPCLVVAAIDPNCFSAIILPPHTRQIWYLLPVCEKATTDGVCIVESFQAVEIWYTPPFTYSYQCSASFITSYAPTFIYMSISTVFLSPAVQYVLFWLCEHLPAGSFAQWLVTNGMSHLILPPELKVSVTGRNETIFGAVGLLVTLITQLGILLTFGAIFPPVALAMAVSITAVVLATVFKTQRFLRASVEKGLLAYADVIDAECARVGTREQLQTAAVILVCYCCAFYAMFLFDALIDVTDFGTAVWVLIVVPLTPIVVFGCFKLFSIKAQNATKSAEDGEVLSVAPGLELSAVVKEHLNCDVEESKYEKGDTVENILHEQLSL